MDTAVLSLLFVLSLATSAARVGHAQQVPEPVCSADVTSALVHHPVLHLGHVALAFLALLFPEGRGQCSPTWPRSDAARGLAHCDGLRGIFKL